MDKNVVKLLTVDKEIVAEEIIELLENNNIEVFKELPNDSLLTELYMNKAVDGVIIFINEDDQEEAKEIVKAFFKEVDF
ncbi:MAG: hypothetical protein U9N10_08575 [Bacillota bacterium]|nr:hypothetical protein [Bacillota bacterium]